MIGPGSFSAVGGPPGTPDRGGTELFGVSAMLLITTLLVAALWLSL